MQNILFNIQLTQFRSNNKILVDRCPLCINLYHYNIILLLHNSKNENSRMCHGCKTSIQ